MPFRCFLLFVSFLLVKTLYCQDKENIGFVPNKEYAIELNKKSQDLLYENPSESLKLAMQAQKIASACKDLNEEARAFLQVSISYYLKGHMDSSETYLDQAFAIASDAKNDQLVARSHNLKGAICQQKNELLRAEESFRLAIEKFEKMTDTISVSKAYSNLSTILNKQGKYYESLEVQHKSLMYFEHLKDTVILAIALNNIAQTYTYINDYSQALINNTRAIELIKPTNHINLLISMYSSHGEILTNQHKYSEAQRHFFNALNLMTNPKENIEYGYLMHHISETDFLLKKINLAKKNNEIAIREFTRYKQDEALTRACLLKVKILMAEQNFKLAKETLGFCFTQLVKLNISDLKKEYYLVASKYYQEIDNFKKSLGYYKQYSELKDSLYQQQKSQELTNILNQHENLKKQQEIELTQNQLKLKEFELEQNKTQQIYTVLLGLLFAVIALLLFSLYKSGKKKNDLIANQFDELSYINVKLNKQSLAIKEKNNTLERYKKDITDSIQYAERIQQALFPSKQTLDNCLDDYFILFKPKDIVSGDFYWIRNFNENKVVVVADCTGHGVPGAFMSLLGITLLTEIVVRNDVTTSDTVMNLLRKNLKEALKQTGGKIDQKDGINMSFIVINRDTNQLQFSGAHSGAYILRDNRIITLKGDVQPIGYYFKEQPFTKQVIDLQKNDKIYMFTDGYVDQFNEQNNRFSKQQLRSLLVRINEEPLSKQKKILEKEFINWQGKQEQFDDVLVFGFSWRPDFSDNS